MDVGIWICYTQKQGGKRSLQPVFCRLNQMNLSFENSVND